MKVTRGVYLVELNTRLVSIDFFWRGHAAALRKFLFFPRYVPVSTNRIRIATWIVATRFIRLCIRIVGMMEFVFIRA